MKARRTIAAIILLVFTACFLALKWKHDEPRRISLQVIQNFGNAIDAKSPRLLDDIVLPKVLTGRTATEQMDFLEKALRDEVSAEGIAALKRDASFGPLAEMFPREADIWSKQVGVRLEDCVAFRMENNGVRAEVVLVREGRSYRIVRCNNVKQMARKG